jgi:OpgC protein
LNVDGAWFGKSLLGPGRVIAALWVFAAGYELLTVCWRPFSRVLGWLLLPLGQHALTAFVLHSIAVYSVQRLPGWPFPDHDATVVGFIHLGIVLAVWGATLAVVHIRSRCSQPRVAQAKLIMQAD